MEFLGLSDIPPCRRQRFIAHIARLRQSGEHQHADYIEAAMPWVLGTPRSGTPNNAGISAGLC